MALALLAWLAPQASAADCPALPIDPPAATVRAASHPGLRIGLALGGGSMHGLAHLGVIRELEAVGLDVRVVSGTSVGAVVGALWASGLKAREVETFVRDKGWDNVGRFAMSWQGVFSSQAMSKPLDEAFRQRTIETWPRRFGAVATNLGNGHRRVLMAGDGASAVLASSAVPVFFQPVMRDGERLADGALVEPVPVKAAREMGADFVIAVDVAYRPYEEDASGLAGIGFQSVHILINSLAAEQLKAADVAIRLDLHHQLMTCGPDAVIAAGGSALRKSWPEIARRLGEAARRRAKR